MPYSTAEKHNENAKRRRQSHGDLVRARERAAYAQWLKRHPESRLRRYRKAMLRRYRLTEEQYQNLLVTQNGVCAICHCPETRQRNGRVDPLTVDHDHVTGRIRGLLCHRCNTAIGLFKDDTSRLLAAVAYLKRDGEGAKADK